MTTAKAIRRQLKKTTRPDLLKGRPGGSLRGELFLLCGFGFRGADRETDRLGLAPLAAFEVHAPEVFTEGLNGGDFAIFGALCGEGLGATTSGKSNGY